MGRTGCRSALACIGLVASLWGTPVASQESRLPLPSDENRAILPAAQAAIAAGDLADAVDRWQSLLDMPEDYFDPAVPGSSLRTRAETNLLSSSPECRDVYEVRFGPQARALLSDALRDDDGQRLSEVIRRYFGTVAGHAAGSILAQRLADKGEALSAAQLYDRLTRHPRTTLEQRSEWLLRSAVCWRLAGFAPAADERLAARDRGAADTPAGRGAGDPAFPTDAQDRLAQTRGPLAADRELELPETTTFRGNPQRNGVFVPAVPVGPTAWERPTVDEFDCLDAARATEVAGRMRGLSDRHAAADADRVLLPAGVPVTAAGLVVFRGPGTIKAVSLATGELAWPSVLIDDTFHQLVTREWSRRDEDWHGPNLDLLLAQRMWRDATAAALCTDGRYVYAITDGGMISSIVQSAVSLPALSDHPLAPHANNRLLAFELEAGRLRWELGGPRSTGLLSGAFFLGAPLPLDGQLYCLVEDQGQVQLVVLDPGTNDVALAWSQALYNPIANLSNPAVGTARRMAGLTPAASGDLVICPTGETTVVAVDRRRRALMWAHEYQRPITESPQQALMIRMAMQRRELRGRIEDQLTDDLLKADHWQDSAPIIAGERVLLTPPDSQHLLCLHLLDGSEVWRRPRGGRQAIAAVHNGRVVMIGEDQVEALDHNTGEPAWAAALPIPGPGGRGFQHGRWYVLPLETGEAATIDLETGRETARTPLPASCVRGNFTAADGRIVCQTAIGVQALRTLPELSAAADAQIAANGGDAAALLRRGAIRLHLGEEAAALDDLRRAVAVDPDSPARKVLAATLIEGLRTDFDGYRGAAPEIERLASDVAERALFHRLFAAGLQRRGEIEAAFQQYLKFADGASGFAGLQTIDGARQVRGDLWIAGRLEELLDSADPQARGRLRSELSRTVDAALAAAAGSRLATLRRVVPDPLESARIDQHLLESGDLPAPQVESVLLELLDSADPQLSAGAAARLADRWLSAGLPSDLLDRLLNQLAGPLNGIECLNGQTGRELLTAWRADPQRAALINAPNPWPTTHVTSEELSPTLPAQLSPVRHLGTRSELLSGWTFYTDPAGGKLVAFDRLGRQAWQIPTASTGLLQGRRGPTYVRYVTTFGRYLLLVVEDQWTLLDGLGSEASPTVLASKRLISSSEGTTVIPNFPRMNQPGRNRNRTWIDQQGGIAPLGNVGPIVGGMFVYQSGTRLTAISVSTGEELWTHDLPNLQAGGDIIADGKVVAVWPPGTTELQLFRAVDGSAVGAAKLPADVHLPQPEGYWGTRLVTLNRGVDGAQFEFGLFDPLTQQHVWQRSLSGVADWGVVDSSDFYVLQADGTLRILDDRTGFDLVELSLPTAGAAEVATVWSDADHWYAATYSTPPNDRVLIESQQPQSPPVHGVVLAASRATGEVEWQVPVRYQQLIRELPGAWPVLVLTSQVLSPSSDEPGRKSGRAWTMLLLEKSTGRVLYESTATGSVERYGWLSDPEHHTIHLAAGAIRTSLRFSAAPADPPPTPNQ